ncbi:bactofilin family protein [Agarilytica rhodophyticola]|uniref:bactofilin family protein n=1 Tax=Agarilytica rhodophyticola TaxID=1737490 RepID=UPI001FE7DBA7|nr:polymer-forming cytoskeletal protein [Agarilytica rhodophyticola]
MDITFSKIFSSSEEKNKNQPLNKSQPPPAPKPKVPEEQKPLQSTAQTNNLGDSSMLSNRSEKKQEEATVYPTAVNTNTSIKPKVETKRPAAVIGSQIRFKGELVGEEDLLIEGYVEGTIDLKGHNLIVGEQGVVHANVNAKTVAVEGKVEGDLFGEERIAIRASSQVQGNIKAERVILEDGAKFRGSIDMDMDSSGATSTPIIETISKDTSSKENDDS